MKIAIIVEGGIVQHVISDEEITEVTVIDHDTKGLEDNEVKQVEGWRSYVYDVLKRSELNPERVEEIYNEINNQVKKEENK